MSLVKAKMKSLADKLYGSEVAQKLRAEKDTPVKPKRSTLSAKKKKK